MKVKSLKSLNGEFLKGKKIIVRVDFNVPLNEKLEITNDVRIKRA
ncbi:MAG: phosphoglycerate kinase, partial [Candidatus Atribacteria bacterium]|nr:phosphoglycerate kinase [Candidatus Atribacteria bacterium]